MRIAVNTRLLLSGRLEGIGWFTAETLKRITVAHPECRFIFLFDRSFSDEFIYSSNIEPVILPPQARHPLLWYLWFEYAVPYAMRKFKPDLFLSPDGYLSLSTQVKSLPVIHDINFMHHYDYNPFITGSYYRRFFPKFAGKATRIATVSNFSKSDISSTFGVDEKLIDVLYNGKSTLYGPLDDCDLDQVKKEFAEGNDYFIFVGSFHQRKNICGILRVFDKYREKSGKSVKLILVGERMYSYREMDSTLENMKWKSEVIFAGRLDQNKLKRLYGAALALLFIPFFEGFGIPILEAMACNIPVIASNRTSVPEVVGDAGIIVDPFSEDSIVQAMMDITYDHDLRKVLIDKGKIVAEKYSWDSTAGLLWSSIEKCLDS